MPQHVIFAAPFFLEATLRFIGAAARLPGVSLSVVSQDPAEKMPAGLKALGMETGLSHMEWFRLRDGRIAVSEVVENPLSEIVKIIRVELG